MWERDYENWRDSFYCGGERPVERIEAELGAIYELYDYINDKVMQTVVCTEYNKDKIEDSLNDSTNDMWTYRRA